MLKRATGRQRRTGEGEDREAAEAKVQKLRRTMGVDDDVESAEVMTWTM